ncbi:MAG: dimethyl sulfoxide reductase anchor subunit [Proteobacteria bacterium]|jgi:DMSO reductase anchor subunit|nr:dimethyl sulfoxide reductase anchor subunit [Pseudomonadota bacterium]MDA0960073.1 dimethyl sulfoxide reductase anchor subunit [Pseudomonadota bacterium]MDA1152922.1 dimethyl sulfoxide reductase anchor subunit [Pseudomonadota bacterium]
MRPAWSIIFFTSISGLGFGLAAWVVLGFVDLAQPQHIFGVGGIVLLLIGAGLLSSTLHLGHPERAWRALSQWRSSWLSREGVLAVLAMLTLVGWGWHLFAVGTPPLWMNIAAAALMLVTVYATSMIYASLKTVARWHHPLTPICYLMFAAAGGLLAILFLLAVLGQANGAAFEMVVLLAMASAWGVKLVWWQLAGAEGSGSTLASATGLGSLGTVRSIMPPHTSENYLQHEMGFVVARKHAAQLRLIALGLGGGVPCLLVIIDAASVIGLGIALAAHIAGVFVERWLFFAEAKHTVSLYYGQQH